jgi:hypothetical protein
VVQAAIRRGFDGFVWYKAGAGASFHCNLLLDHKFATRLDLAVQRVTCLRRTVRAWLAGPMKTQEILVQEGA